MTDRELCVIDRFLGDDGISDLLRKVESSKPSILRLVLRGNCLGVQGARELAGWLEKDECELEELSLEWNQLKDAGCVVLAKSLQRNTSLLHLDMRNNAIRNEGAKALATALAVNRSLRSLDLRWNAIEDGGATPFKDHLLDRVPNLKFQISGNHLSTQVANQVIEWCNGEDEFVENDITVADDKSTHSNSSPHLEKKSNSHNNGINISPSEAGIEAANHLMKQENLGLRKQLQELQHELSNMHRQLESSALQVTEMEQTILKEQFRADQLDEQYRHANLRISAQTEEMKKLNQSWQEDKRETLEDMKKKLNLRQEETEQIAQERDDANIELRRNKDALERANNKLTEQARQFDLERNSLQTELSSTHSQVTELSLANTRIDSELNTAKNGSQRMEKQINQLQSELDKTREDAEKEMKRELGLRDESETKLREDYEKQLSASADKVNRQNKELEILYKKVSTLQSDLSTIKGDMELERDRAVNAAREEEAKRCDTIVNDQKEKLDLFLSTRAELEKRCETFLNELKETQKEQSNTNASMKKQLENNEIEMERLREQNNSLKTSLTSLQTTHSSNSVELTELRSRYHMLDEQSTDTSNQLKNVLNERDLLKKAHSEVELERTKLQAQRRTEFHTIVNNITSTMKKEFEIMQTSMGIKSEEASS